MNNVANLQSTEKDPGLVSLLKPHDFRSAGLLPVLGAVLVMCAVPARAAFIWRAHYEDQKPSWDGSKWNLGPWPGASLAKAPYPLQIVTSPVRLGTYAARIEVRPNDDPYMWPAGSSISTSGVRAEVRRESDGSDGETEGAEFWYAVSFLFPADWVEPPQWGLVSQWHAVDFATSPPVGISARANSLLLVLKPGEVTKTGTKTFTILSDLNKGVWNDLKINIRWSTTSGHVKVYHRKADDKAWTLKVDTGTIPTLQNQNGKPVPVYYRQGLYRGGKTSNVTNVLWIDSGAMATTEADIDAHFAGTVVTPAPTTPVPAAPVRKQ